VRGSLVRPLDAAEPVRDEAVPLFDGAPLAPSKPTLAVRTPPMTGLVPLVSLWLLVLLPLAWGLWATLRQAAVLFR